MSAAVSIIEPSGILDSTEAESFRQQVDEALEQGIETVLIDLQHVSFVDSSGLGALVVALKKFKAMNRVMYICSVNDQVRMLFELTSMDRVFEVLRDRAEFDQRMARSST